jgi:hypothetical protein
MFKPERLTFEQLSERLRAYEHKYGYSTIEFYSRFESGELGHDDGPMTWAGLYHLYLTSLPIRQFMQTEPVPA